MICPFGDSAPHRRYRHRRHYRCRHHHRQRQRQRQRVRQGQKDFPTASTDALRHHWELSRLDLAADLNDAGCSLLAKGQHDLATATLTDALGALSCSFIQTSPTHHHVDSAEYVSAETMMESYLSYRAQVWSASQDRLDSAERRLRRRQQPNANGHGNEEVKAAEAGECGAARSREESFEQRQQTLVHADPVRLDHDDRHYCRRYRDAENKGKGSSDDEDAISVGIIDGKEEEGCPPRSLEELTAVVLYNLALAHHLTGEATGSIDYVRRAVQLYDLSETMILKEKSAVTTEMTTIQTQLLSKVFKSVLNNVGQISLVWMGSPTLGKMYFERLVDISMKEEASAATVPGATTTKKTVVSTRSWGGQRGTSFDAFSFNALVVRGINAASAA